MLTGVIGSIMVTPLMNALLMTDWRARGFAVGLASHGIGTARAFQVNSLAGTFAGIAMGLNALVTALLLPFVLKLLLK
jgi:putative effector of murein hydrolase